MLLRRTTNLELYCTCVGKFAFPLRLSQLGFYNRNKRKLHAVIVHKDSGKLTVAYNGSTRAKQGIFLLFLLVYTKRLMTLMSIASIDTGTIDPDFGSASAGFGLPFILVLDRGIQTLMLYQSSAIAPAITVNNVGEDEEEKGRDEDTVTFYRV